MSQAIPKRDFIQIRDGPHKVQATSIIFMRMFDS